MADNKENKLLEKMLDSLYLNTAVKDCYKELCKSQDAVAFETSAGFMVDTDTMEAYQVQVKVVKEVDMFLGDFEIVEIIDEFKK